MHIYSSQQTNFWKAGAISAHQSKQSTITQWDSVFICDSNNVCSQAFHLPKLFSFGVWMATLESVLCKAAGVHQQRYRPINFLDVHSLLQCSSTTNPSIFIRSSQIRCNVELTAQVMELTKLWVHSCWQQHALDHFSERRKNYQTRSHRAFKRCVIWRWPSPTA